MKYLSHIATFISCIGGFLFGYDIGVISGVLTMPTFPKYFGIQGNAAAIANKKGDIVSILQVGCCVGALLSNLISDPIGRKKSIVVYGIIFLLGSALQVGAHNLATMMAGRFIGGMGIGGCSSLIPVYIAEIAPRKIRGRLGTLWQFLIVIGIMASYWIDYGCLRGIPTGDTQWRVPLAIQLVPGAILCFGMIFLPESLRWYASRGRHEQVLTTLSKLRDLPEDHPEVQAEYEEILQASNLENEGKSGKYSELFHGHNLHRLSIGIMLHVFAQWTGTSAINYYAPDIFESIGLSSDETSILATGVYGTIKVVIVFFSFFTVDTNLGRRRILFIGSAIIMISYFVLGGMILGLQKDNGGGDLGAGAQVDAKGYVAMVMIYLFAVGYEFSWGPIPWIVSSEIYSTNLRIFASSLGAAFNWAMSATIAKVAPIMINNITYGTYFFFGSFAFIMGIYAYLFVPETKGRSLEEIDEMFSQGSIWAFKDDYKVDNFKVKEEDEESGVYKDKATV